MSQCGTLSPRISATCEPLLALTHTNTLEMAGESVPAGLDLKEKGEEELWELINDNRHRISLGVRPCIVIPYLRQARVLTEMDEDEILSSHNLTNRSMRTSHMMDLLRTQGRNGAVALLESLMIHYPTLYTQVTGRKPSSEPSRFSGLIKYSELTEYLIRAVTAMQNELQETRSENGKMNARCASLESEIQLVVEREESSSRLQAECERLQRHASTLQREVANLKDEKCDLYMRYTAAIEEKSAMNMRLHDLNLQTYQLQTELQKAETERDFQKRRSLRCVSQAEASQLQEEVRTLRFQLKKIEKLNPVQQAILPRDVAEAIDSQAELVEKLRCSREENEKLHKEKQDLLDQSESVTVQVHQLTLDCNMHQQKSTVIQNQMRELQTERDQAFLSRNEAQIQIASILAEKDSLRSQIMELKKAFSLHDKCSKDPQSSDVSGIACKCDHSSIPNRRKLCRKDAVNPSSPNRFSSECDDSMASSVEPPSPQSLHVGKGALHEENSLETVETDDFSLDDFVILPNVLNEGKETSTPFVPGRTNSMYSLDKNSVPPFLVRSRPKAIRISGRVVTISFRGDALPNQIVVAGGNKTGVFVHQVTEGSAAHTAGVSPGAQIVEVKYQQNQKAIRVVLEDSTLEEAMWALGQVTDLCHLSLRPRQDDYEALLQQLQNDEMSSGDSFYVRVNVTIPAGPKGTMAISCNDILHVTNTRPANTDDSWYASQVDAYKLLAHQSQLVPNYYRAQRLLIRAIEEMNFQTRKSEKEGHVVAQNTRKAVRIVSTYQQGRNPLWVSVENEKTKSTELEVLSPSDHSVRLQKSQVLEECGQGRNCCYTLQSVQKVMKKGIHCVLPLGLDCVRRLHRAEIFPIIIFFCQSTCSARKLRLKLHRHSLSEEQLLVCSKSEEPLLDKLPCLYHKVAPDLWCGQNSLLTKLRSVISVEQRKIVWVEPDLW
ncbi:caspase recruitment domain-containing protein 14 isoform X2 [Nerophis ophidion]|uniref:caspase recruitment domain-containing protein 14 isoform X2 n=1 Tax=Nerophis ophidion TaxID=159077 RepID=UPI002ADF2EA2|nr:caspase recruitment domain-containing protein 14 isoform X2 [Nerophis ophidion]